MSYLFALLLLIILLAGWCLNLFGLPGNWINVAAAATYAFLLSGSHRTTISWWIVAVALGLAILGELLESFASGAGVAKAGGSRRGIVLGVVGSVLGGVAGAFIGLPIPVIGSVIAIILFAGLGALAGAAVGELWKGRDWRQAWQIGHIAFWGRILGTAGKVYVGTLIVFIVAVALVF